VAWQVDLWFESYLRSQPRPGLQRLAAAGGANVPQLSLFAFEVVEDLDATIDFREIPAKVWGVGRR
jgi:hypothetical protein